MPAEPQPMSPCAVFGLSTYNGADHVAEAIESLLGQTRDDFAVVVVDDCSTDRTPEIARRYAEFDSRVTYERNERRLGLVLNWRRAFALTAERFPSAPYFAWASDHDVWHPNWLDTLAAELEAHPEAVLAYPFGTRIDEFGSEYPTRERPFDTAGVTSPSERVHRTGRELPAAGEMVYGLARRAALDRCGSYPLVVLADRLHLLRLAVEGEFRQVPRRLWSRRYRAGVVMSNSRQRLASFPEGVPALAYAPWWVAHGPLFVRSLGTDRRRFRLGALVLVDSVLHAHERRRRRKRRERRWRRRRMQLRYRGLLRSALRRLGLEEHVQRRVRRAGTESRPPAEAPPRDELQPSEALAALERAELLDSIAAPGAVVLCLGESSQELAAQLDTRFPRLVVVRAGDARTAVSALPRARIDLAISVGAFEELTEGGLERLVGLLHELGTPVLYSLDRDAPGHRACVRRWYWLRQIWLPGGDGQGRATRKPDPLTGPVPDEPGRPHHLIGRRRLLPELGSASGRKARMAE